MCTILRGRGSLAGKVEENLEKWGREKNEGFKARVRKQCSEGEGLPGARKGPHAWLDCPSAYISRRARCP